MKNQLILTSVNNILEIEYAAFALFMMCTLLIGFITGVGFCIHTKDKNCKKQLEIVSQELELERIKEEGIICKSSK